MRAAFVAAPYGPPGARFGLSGVDGGWTPPWGAGGRSWALVTAWNAGGVRRGRAANVRAAGALCRAWGRAAVPVVNGRGAWAEDALLLPGARLRDAVALGARFGQAAVLYGVGRRAALVWTAAGRGPRVRVERLWAVPYTGSP